MTKLLSRLAAFAGALALAGPAVSRPMVTTFNGFVAADDTSGRDLDVAGLFGGGDLEGLAVQAAYSFDSSLGVESTDGSTFDQIVGGPEYGVSAISSVAYTIAGHTYQFVPDQFQSLLTQALVPAGDNKTPGFLIFAANSFAFDQSFVQIETASAPSSLSTAFQGTADDKTVGTLYTYFLPGQTLTGQYDAITFDVTSVSSAAVSAAPEPGTWWLLIGGTAAMGLTLRARRRRRALVLA